MKFQIILQ